MIYLIKCLAGHSGFIALNLKNLYKNLLLDLLPLQTLPSLLSKLGLPLWGL